MGSHKKFLNKRNNDKKGNNKINNVIQKMNQRVFLRNRADESYILS